MIYTALKTLHVSLAVLSFSGFLLRTGGQFAGQAWASGKAARTLPHIFDTALLISALFLLYVHQWLPLEQPWLKAKMGGLLLYIFFGAATLRVARDNGQRLLAAVCACTAFAYMVSVAISKSPLPFG
ncbi:SirB2 family protein [Microbulbifer sediminum]|uniref:SirB2 family protein n=1 Tax=Microbulbifer sediminum TaxID=2904250 RepID=UPI001F332BFC|nr:SirB2 family protein [Microbulbifer sediminum]